MLLHWLLRDRTELNPAKYNLSPNTYYTLLMTWSLARLPLSVADKTREVFFGRSTTLLFC